MKKDLFSKNIIFIGAAFILAFLIAGIIYFFDKSDVRFVIRLVILTVGMFLIIHGGPQRYLQKHPKVRTVLRWGIVILILLSAVFLFIIIRG